MKQSRGQAMVELIVALVSVTALFAFLWQIVFLARAHTDAVVEARRKAGEYAIAGVDFQFDPQFIYGWEKNPDPDVGNYSQCDRAVLNAASRREFRDTIVSRAWRAGRAADAAVIAAMPDDRLSQLNDGDQEPEDWFGLVQGIGGPNTVSNLLAVQHLLYAAEEIELTATNWLTLTSGL
jgi:hypothetical protein